MNRATALKEAGRRTWDILVVGGGATGAGVAVDAATRGHSVLLLEANDFAKGTSSRSTKLIHGGVRYLQRGEFRLVAQSLRERKTLLRNAPHLVRIQTFLVPAYRWWEIPYFGLGLKVYDLLSWSSGIGPSKRVGALEALGLIPTIRKDGLRGGILYHDGQFDDSRLVIALIRTAHSHGAHCINHAPVIGILKDQRGQVKGVRFRDQETGEEHEATGKAIVNATGVSCDDLRRQNRTDAAPLVAPSQGTHLVLDQGFLPGNTALMVPRTSDGRVLFAIPWKGKVLAGTTDVAIPQASDEPRAGEKEIEFILKTLGDYLDRAPLRKDVRSIFTGIRPLVKAAGAHTAALSRDFLLRDEGGLLTVTGGKWTTYRHMAEKTTDRAEEIGSLPRRSCVTSQMPIHGSCQAPQDPTDPLSCYGSEAPEIRSLRLTAPELATPLHPAFAQTGAEVVWAARHEMARTVEDVLARRMRILFLDAHAAINMAPQVARILATELNRPQDWVQEQIQSFTDLARQYLPD